MQQERFIYLLKQYKDGLLTAEEGGELMEFCSADHEAEMLAFIQSRMEQQEQVSAPDDVPAEQLQAVLTKILSVDKLKNQVPGIIRTAAPATRRIYYLRLVRRAAAAAILLLFGTGVYYIVKHPYERRTAGILKTPVNDVAPGGNKATLTLSNGATIILDSAGNGRLASQGNTDIVKESSGMLAYSRPVRDNEQRATGNGQQIQYNILTTPRGGQYRLRLPDGTEVWLNAASSIRFPVAFTGKEREVEVTGETYFEVAQNAAMPFVVRKGNTEVQVLGTHFDMNAYDDESDIKTTVLDGSVRVSTSGIRHPAFSIQHPTSNITLTPGQQALVNAGGGITLNKNADTTEVVAWKNGKFRFDNTGLTELMRQLARWYDVTVTYTGDVKDYTGKYAFVGEIERSSNLSIVLKLLEIGGVHFRIEGRELIVMP